MEETSTQITWPSKLKIGAKSKKGTASTAFTIFLSVCCCWLAWKFSGEFKYIIISVWLAGWLWTFLGGYPSEVYQTLRYQIEYDNLHLAFSVHNSFDDHDSLPHHVKTVTEKKLVISW